MEYPEVHCRSDFFRLHLTAPILLCSIFILVFMSSASVSVAVLIDGDNPCSLLFRVPFSIVVMRALPFLTWVDPM